MNQATPNWQPISALSMVASFIDGMVTDTGAQWETAALFEEQLARWRTQRLSPEQSDVIARLEGQVEQLQANLRNILNLADEVKDKTIDQILEKSDFDLGLECLLGKHRL